MPPLLSVCGVCGERLSPWRKHGRSRLDRVGVESGFDNEGGLEIDRRRAGMGLVEPVSRYNFLFQDLNVGGVLMDFLLFMHERQEKHWGGYFPEQ